MMPVRIPERDAGTEDEEESIKSGDTVRIDGEDTSSPILPRSRSPPPPPTHQVTSLPSEMPEEWAKSLKDIIATAFQEELAKCVSAHDRTREIISKMCSSISSLMRALLYENQLQRKKVMEIKEQLAAVSESLQKNMSSVRMDIRSAQAVSSANQSVILDYLKVIETDQREMLRAIRSMTSFAGIDTLSVTLHETKLTEPSRHPIQKTQGEASCFPTHSRLSDSILEAQHDNPELSSHRFVSTNQTDGTKALGTDDVSHFTGERTQEQGADENLKRTSAECGVLQGLAEMATASRPQKRTRT